MKISGHKNLTLARLLETPEPEFKDCERCGIRLGQGRQIELCVDCNVVNRFTTPVPFAGNGGSYAEVDPAYEIALHYPARPTGCPTMATINALKLPFVAYYATRDPIEFTYAKSLITSKGSEPVDYPIVVITSRGQYVDHWSGYNLQAINAIPAARAAAIQMSQTPHGFDEARVPNRELEAA